MDFISLPVVSGFTTATAITIISSSLRPLMGINDTFELGSDFIRSWKVIFENFHIIKCGDTLAGILTLLILVFMRAFERIPFYHKFFHFLSKLRVITVIVVGSLAAYYFEVTYGTIPFAITGKDVQGEPDFRPPEFSYTSGNTTLNVWGMVELMGLKAASIPIVAITQLFVTAKVFCK